MLVYVLINVCAGVLSDCSAFENRPTAEQEYSEWVEEQSSKDDVFLVECETTPTSTMSGLPPLGDVIAESYGEG